MTGYIHPGAISGPASEALAQLGKDAADARLDLKMTADLAATGNGRHALVTAYTLRLTSRHGTFHVEASGPLDIVLPSIGAAVAAWNERGTR